MMSTLPDWIFVPLAWVMGGGGAVLALWALFWNRARGRRRCPSCWYDMAGVPGLVCPECGRDARRERWLKMTRRRWRFAALAALLILIGTSLPRIPEVRDHGWPGAFPTTILIAGLTPLARPDEAGQWEPTARTRLFHTLTRRMHDGRLYSWQRRWLIERCVKGIQRHALSSDAGRWKYRTVLTHLEYHAEFGRVPPQERPTWFTQRPIAIGDREFKRIREGIAHASISMRDRWPVGVPLRVRVHPAGFDGPTPRVLTVRAHLPHAADCAIQLSSPTGENLFPMLWSDNTAVVGTPSSPSNRLSVEFSLLTRIQSDLRLFRSTIRRPIQIAGTVDDILQPFESDAFSAALRDSLHPLLGRHEDQAVIVKLFDVRALSDDFIPKMKEHRVTLAVRLELRQDSEVIAAADAWWTLNEYGDGNGPPVVHIGTDIVVLEPVGDSRPQLASYEGLTLRLVGDPLVALRNFQSTTYWRGEVEVPVQWRTDYFRMYERFRLRQ